MYLCLNSCVVVGLDTKRLTQLFIEFVHFGRPHDLLYDLEPQLLVANLQDLRNILSAGSL
jgi:hypothetical protein